MPDGSGPFEKAALNKGFAWPTAPCGGGMVTAQQAAQWDEQGYLLLKGVLDPVEVAEVAAVIDEQEKVREAQLRAEGPRRYDINDADAITFTTHIVARSERARAFASSEPFQRICKDLLGERVRMYWDQAVYKKPEPDRDFPWHQDTGYTFVEPQHYLTCWTPLTPATLDNGCPWVAPGVHREGTLKHWWTDLGWRCLQDFEGAVAIEAEVGDVVCFSSLTPHRTGPNRTAAVRKAYILQYALDPTVQWAKGAPSPVLQQDPARQFWVVGGG